MCQTVLILELFSFHNNSKIFAFAVRFLRTTFYNYFANIMNQNTEFSIFFFIIMGTVGKIMGTVGKILDRWGETDAVERP
jgi:TRAP-type mannitol/chloroaromatic compound transport system permease large subunit